MLRTDLLRYMRVHHVGRVMAGVTVVAVVSAVLGSVELPISSPRSDGTTTGIPFRRELPLLPAVFLAAMFASSMRDHEEIAGQRYFRVRAASIGACTVLASTILFFSETVAVGPANGLIFVRSLLIWWGLATLSARLGGPQLAWVLPLASSFPLIWWSPDPWDWTTAAATDPLSWCSAIFALLIGQMAVAATPWRRRALRQANHLRTNRQ